VRIIQIVPSLAAGGLERVATTLTLRLAATGDDVVVCTRGASTHRAFLDELVAAGIAIELVPRPRPRPDLLLRSGIAIARVLRAVRPDVIHAHNPAASGAGAVARVLARQGRVPIVTTFHGLVDGGTSAGARLLRATADVVVGIGPAATRELVRAGLDEAHTATVLNAVDARPVRPPAEVRRELGLDDAELVVTVGRYRAEKNQALLLEAARLLAPRRPRLRVLLVGVGPLEDELRRLVTELGLDGVATVTGLRADAVDIAAAADVATLTSTREGLGLTLIEAMAAGTPVVGTAVGGIPDVIEDGRTGLLVPSGDAHALAAAIESLLDDRARAARLAEAAREDAGARFGVDAMTTGYRAVYERALRTRAAARRTGASPSK
jgi:glycosyltransferase involved in cell wall biosynthesis